MANKKCVDRWPRLAPLLLAAVWLDAAAQVEDPAAAATVWCSIVPAHAPAIQCHERTITEGP